MVIGEGEPQFAHDQFRHEGTSLEHTIRQLFDSLYDYGSDPPMSMAICCMDADARGVQQWRVGGDGMDSHPAMTRKRPSGSSPQR
ncbi:Uncharacterised protein [Mycobacteroides abscessus subsp. abscessus]|nr:Uncharacterised protein [Mycobacteroides abscessus subsp. abscessus]